MRLGSLYRKNAQSGRGDLDELMNRRIFSVRIYLLGLKPNKTKKLGVANVYYPNL